MKTLLPTPRRLFVGAAALYGAGIAALALQWTIGVQGVW